MAGGGKSYIFLCSNFFWWRSFCQDFADSARGTFSNRLHLRPSLFVCPLPREFDFSPNRRILDRPHLCDSFLPMQTTPLVRCGRCARQAISRSRCFSTTYSLQALGPESPSWLEVPKLEQPPTRPPPPVKGILPIPKSIIADSRAKYKATKKYLDQTAPAPKEESTIDLEKEYAYQEVYKKQVSTTRRELLREGMQDLFRRRVNAATSDLATKRAKRQKDLEALNRPKADDEVLTEESIPKVVRDALAWKPQKINLSDEEKLAKRKEYDDTVERRIGRKMEAVHDLYLNAREFIIDPKQLNDEIEKVFGPDDNPIVWEGMGYGTSPWKHGPPLGTSQLAAVSEISNDLKLENEAARQRMLRIAGELTGGRISQVKTD
jgi:hypothetical protein